MAKIVPHYNPEYRVSFDVDETLVKLVDEKLVTHSRHIESIKSHWYRGHHVCVQSAGGSSWAKYIIKRLGLEDFVHEARAKDRWYYDDLPADEWMDRVYHYQEGFNNGRTVGSYAEVDRNNKTGVLVPAITFGGGSLLYTTTSQQSGGLIEQNDPDKSGSGA